MTKKKAVPLPGIDLMLCRKADRRRLGGIHPAFRGVDGIDRDGGAKAQRGANGH